VPGGRVRGLTGLVVFGLLTIRRSGGRRSTHMSSHDLAVHGADDLQVRAKAFPSFATVDLYDEDGNEITLFFSNLRAIGAFAAKVEGACTDVKEASA
jgi:hypothetical protein